MTEGKALRELKQGSEDALCWFIDRYTPYVSTIIYNVIGSSMDQADIEEVTSDVFLAFWHTAQKVRTNAVRGYLGSIARNKAKNKLRSLGCDLPLEEDILVTDGITPEGTLEQKELREVLQRAVLAMHQPDRDIFLRYYYYYQSIEQISREMDLNPANVKTRLHRGRQRLKDVMLKYLS